MPAPQYTIHVTKEVFKKAIPNNSRHCLIAEAIRQTLKAESINVNDSDIRFNYAGKRHMYVTPASLALKVQGFDSGEVIKPFTFRLHQGMSEPIKLLGPQPNMRKKKPRKLSKPSARRCIRRYRGTQLIEKVSPQ